MPTDRKLQIAPAVVYFWISFSYWGQNSPDLIRWNNSFKLHVAWDIGISQKYLSNEKTQQYSQSISEWTNKKKMKLNVKRTKVMVRNFTKIHQFLTKIFMEGQLLEIIEDSKLLGCIISLDLKFKKKYCISGQERSHSHDQCTSSRHGDNF